VAIYRVKYELQFSDVKGNGRVVQILKKDYFGAVLELIGTDNPVQISWENDDDFYNPIIGSACTLNLVVTDTITYDEFYVFDEREYKLRILDGQTTDTVGTDSEWQTENDNFDDANFAWAESGDFNIYWEGWLVTDQFREQIVSTPYNLSLNATDGLGTLDSYDAPEGQIALDGNGNPITTTGGQNNYNSFFYYIRKILDNLELGFDIYIQNLIESNTALTSNSIFHDINVFEFATYKDLVRRNSKDLLIDILNVCNSRIFQSNGSWYVMSNSNNYDTRVIPITTTTTLFGLPTVVTNDLVFASNTTMTMSLNITSLGQAALTDAGWYIGTDATSYLNNTKISSASITSTGVHTKISPTLIQGQTYYCTAFATNLYGTTIGDTVECVAGSACSGTTSTTTTTTTTLAPNVWLLSNPNGTSQYVQIDLNYSVGNTVEISGGGTTCYTIASSTYLANAASYPTITQACQNNNSFLMTEVFTGLPALTQISASFNVGDTVTKSDTGTACFLITAEQIAANPGSLPTVTGLCATTTTTTTTSTTTTTTTTTQAANSFVVERNSDGFVTYAQINNSFGIGDQVYVSNDGTNCYTIGGTATLLDPSPYPTVTQTCATTTTAATTTTTTQPTLTYFRRYVDCATGGNDATKYFGNNQDRFPTVVEDTNGECWFNPSVTSVTSNLWIDQTDSNGDRLYPQYSTCNNCVGETTTSTTTTTTTTTTTAAIYYALYVECSDPQGQVLYYSNTSNSFPQTIRKQINGIDECFNFVQNGGQGQNGSISTIPAGDRFANCTNCNAAATTTTTTTTTTTQAQCVAISVYLSSTSAVDACCTSDRVRNVYANSSQLSTATALYTSSACTSLLSAQYMTEDGQTYYYWSGTTLTSATCPSCP
jgi:hypothetical protein